MQCQRCHMDYSMSEGCDECRGCGDPIPKKETTKPRCTGHCCEDFILPFTPEQVVNYKKRIAAGQKKIVYEKKPLYQGSKSYPNAWDVEGNQLEQVLDMIVFKRSDWFNPQYPRGRSALRDFGAFERNGMMYQHYTCKNYVNGGCAIYNDRPKICRIHGEHPDECQYRDCTNKTGCYTGTVSMSIDEKNREVLNKMMGDLNNERKK
jgi:Fe-S-cluster containining protein